MFFLCSVKNKNLVDISVNDILKFFGLSLQLRFKLTNLFTHDHHIVVNPSPRAPEVDLQTNTDVYTFC